MKAAIFLLLALLIPACGGKDQGGADLPPGGLSNPDQITVDLQNNDPTAYNLSAWEFVNGTASVEIRIAWPIAAAAGGVPTSLEGTANFRPDSGTVTHKIILFTTAGVILDSSNFVKGAGQVLLVTTIQSGKLTVTPTQF